MDKKVTLEFTIYDRAQLRASYALALLDSGYDAAEQVEKLVAFDQGDEGSEADALRECFANAVDWMKFGVEY